MKVTSLKKKVRGIKRNLKRIESWRNENLTLDVESFKRADVVYKKLWIRPWYNLYRDSSRKDVCSLVHKQPTRGVKSAMASALLDVCKSWGEQLVGIEEPTYLNVWLFDRDFMTSQVVATMNENRVQHYENLFPLAEENAEGFPHSSFGLTKEQADEFHWEKRIHFVDVFENDENIESYRKIYKESETQEATYVDSEGEEHKVLRFLHSYVWVGTPTV